MKIFGTVSSFDNHNGVGFIKPEAGGSDLSFERSAIAWDGKEFHRLPASACRMTSARTASASRVR